MGRVVVTLVGAVVGAVLMSGSDQPVTAHSYPRWQELAAPPLAPRSAALGVRVGQRVLVLGGVGSDGVALRDGASYDLPTGTWRRLLTPVAFTARDRAAAAAGVAVVRHATAGHAAAWWRYDVRRDAWSRMYGVPAQASAPSAFRSEIYAVAGRHVEVYSVQLGRWTALPADRLRPRLTQRHVRASLGGTVVTGYAGPARALLADRWDGRSWHRVPRPAAASVEPFGPLPDGVPARGATRVSLGARLLVVVGARAWIHTP
jgi:hypothetical protein